MPSIHGEVQQAVASAAGARVGFAARTRALELLEIHVLERLQLLEERSGLSPELEASRTQAEAVRDRLEGANERFLTRVRRRIQRGAYTPDGLKRAFARHSGPLDGDDGGDGYDTLDMLVGRLLGDGAPSEERAEREPEMVAYQPTPARAILALIERARIAPGDLLVDLGSGLGHVVILVALLSGARARGIEVEPAYCDHARRCVSRLEVPRVELIQADAREASLADGTVFFLYTPFRGAMLRQVLERLRTEAARRPLRVCTYGPCTAEVAAASWLRPENPGELVAHEVAVFQPVRP